MKPRKAPSRKARKAAPVDDPKEPLLSSFARKVGHAAGTIARATQKLASDAIVAVPMQKASSKSARNSNMRVAAKSSLKKKRQKKNLKSLARKPAVTA